jgi:uncharacterized MAPEG superfamily protein
VIKKESPGDCLWNNHNPRSAKLTTLYHENIPAECFARYERAEAAHLNGMENAPFFVGAVLAGNMAGVNTRTYSFRNLTFRLLRSASGTMNIASGSYVALRVLYTVLYVNIGSQKLSYFRSLTWGASVASLMWLYVKAGKVWALRQ